MLKVGINENVTFAGAQINDKGSLVLAFSNGSGASLVDPNDPLNMLAEVRDRSTTNVILWPFKAEDAQGTREVKRISQDIAALRDQLHEVLSGYFTGDEARLNPYEGVDTDASVFAASLQKQTVLDRIYKNLTTQFIAKMTSLPAERLEEKFRLLMVRTSKTKHFPTFRKNFITDNPFFESMRVPAEASKLRFTKYERENGLDSGDAVKQEAADSTPAGEETTANDILGMRI